jgi:hypothetical protein
MLLTVGALLALAATVIVYRAFAPPRENPEGLGRMSQQWLVENRASDRP